MSVVGLGSGNLRGGVKERHGNELRDLPWDYGGRKRQGGISVPVRAKVNGAVTLRCCGDWVI